ncbi:hypothetical protein [Caldimonas brevitalea]|uniref:O-GlcNAc transferase C-terminal domain-containing protein n=1 Tax=Caldimonas brevitalea TaxID=413882 RepID=A0A0G3BIS5_9BURK|nr:hypothetical protein [Caldimonas brevitalea]AKJ27898.1 hypothetical protein AAW51_1207 [Caldimonas brevitalea]
MKAAETLQQARLALHSADFRTARACFDAVLRAVPAEQIRPALWFGYACTLAALGELRASTETIRYIGPDDRLALLQHPHTDRALADVLAVGWDAHQVQGLLCAYAMRQGRWEYRPGFVAALEALAQRCAGVPLHRSLVFDAFSFGSDDGLIAALTRRFADDHAPSPAARPAAASAPSPRTDGRLRIALLGGGFRRHPTYFLHRDVVAGLDRARLHLTGIYLDPDVDVYTDDLRGLCDAWQHRAGEDPAEVAQAMRADGYDIVWSLGSFQQSPVAEVLLHRPAQLIVNGLASYYPHGRGLVDYAVIDPITVPPAAHAHWDEALIEFPATPYVLGRGMPGAPAARPDRAALGLPADALVLAATHQSYKLSPECLALWAAVLQRCPQAVLWRLESKPATDAAWRAGLARHGIGPEREWIAPATSWAAHQARLGVADLFLDATPMGGHTTLLEALAQGVPAVTVLGPGPAGRIGHAILQAVGLDDACTATAREYVESVARWAADGSLRRRWREQLQQHLPGGPHLSPALDPARQARWWEQAFTRIWQRHLQGLPPASLRIVDEAQ